MKRTRRESTPRIKPLLWLILIAAILGVLWWRRGKLVSWITGIFRTIGGWGGWGLVLIALALVVLIFLIWRRKLAVFIHRWNRVLGITSFALAAWCILAYLGLGGTFGSKLILDSSPYGVVRVITFSLLGFVLVFPGTSLRLIEGFVSWLGKKVNRGATKSEKRAPRSKKTTETGTAEAEVEAAAKGEAQSDLRQVAQEVWKKYGESPSLFNVDGWRLPPVEILDEAPEVEFSQADNSKRARLIEEALASYGVEAKVVQINVGPTVTQFGIEPGWDRKYREVRERDRDGNIHVRSEEISKTRVKVERITSLANDLALALAAPTIRIEAPVPGKSVVGIEVPNAISALVSLRGVIETNAFQKTEAKSKLAVALGKGAGGEAIAADLTKMPHLLIAGATGSGKTVCLNTIVCCLLMYNAPTEVRFIMIDPKRVELTPYTGIPHMASPVITDTTKALSAMRWLNQEMDHRYEQMAAAGARNIEGYNKKKQGMAKLPYLVLVIDELADLMMTSSDEVEHILCRLAQLARATGIHLVVATQRPSVDVITGLIKANFPTRISFAVTSQVDSRTIIDGVGAEKLLGKGDMLYMPTDAPKPTRLQGCFVSDAEVERLVYFWSRQGSEVTAPTIEELASPAAMAKRGAPPQDALLEVAKQLAREHKNISTSFLQRRLRIGYPRAARIMEQLEEEGFQRGEREDTAA